MSSALAPASRFKPSTYSCPYFPSWWTVLWIVNWPPFLSRLYLFIVLIKIENYLVNSSRLNKWLLYAANREGFILFYFIEKCTFRSLGRQEQEQFYIFSFVSLRKTLPFRVFLYKENKIVRFMIVWMRMYHPHRPASV